MDKLTIKTLDWCLLEIIDWIRRSKDSQINAYPCGSGSGSTKLEATKKVKFCEYFLVARKFFFSSCYFVDTTNGIDAPIFAAMQK